MTIIVQDDFNRANSASVVGTPTIGPAAVTQAGTCGISSNTFYAPAINSIVTWECSTPTVAMEATFLGIGSTRTLALILGYVSASDYWAVTYSANDIALYRVRTALTFTPIVMRPFTPDGTSFLASVSYRDEWVRVGYGGSEVFRVKVGSIAGTKHGLRANTVSSQRVDNLLITDTPPTAPVTITDSDLAIPELLPGSRFQPDGFAYRGRDTKTQDNVGGS